MSLRLRGDGGFSRGLLRVVVASQWAGRAAGGRRVAQRAIGSGGGGGGGGGQRAEGIPPLVVVVLYITCGEDGWEGDGKKRAAANFFRFTQLYLYRTAVVTISKRARDSLARGL